MQVEWDALSVIIAEDEREMTASPSVGAFTASDSDGDGGAAHGATGGSGGAGFRAARGARNGGSRSLAATRRSVAAAKKATKAEKADALQAEWEALSKAMGTEDVQAMVELFSSHEDQVCVGEGGGRLAATRQQRWLGVVGGGGLGGTCRYTCPLSRGGLFAHACSHGVEPRAGNPTVLAITYLQRHAPPLRVSLAIEQPAIKQQLLRSRMPASRWCC